MFYSNLFEIEYQKMFPFIKISKKNLLSIFLISFFIGIVAFIMETLLDYISSNKLYDRGFLIGPFIPLYFSVVFLFLMFVKTPMYCVKNLVKYFLIISIFISIVELLVGNICESIFNVELWKYDISMPFSSKYVSLFVSIIWGIIGDFLLFFVVPLFKKICDKITFKAKSIIVIFSIIYLLIDISLSIFIVVKNGKYEELYGPIHANLELTTLLMIIVLYFFISCSIFVILNTFKLNDKKYLYFLYFASVFIPYISFLNYFINYKIKLLIFLDLFGYYVALTYFILILVIIIKQLIKFTIKTKKVDKNPL